MKVQLEEGFVEYEGVKNLTHDHANSHVLLVNVVDTNIPGFPKQSAVKRSRLKQVKKHSSTPRYDPQKGLRNEAKLRKELSHPHIIKFLGYTNDPINRELHMEYLPETCDVSTFPLNASTFTIQEEEVFTLVKEIASGLDYLHQKGYAHLDVKPGNIGKNGCYKIFDLGIAHKVGNGITIYVDGIEEDCEDDLDEVTSELIEIRVPRQLMRWGSEGYMAPEIRNDGYYSTAADCYSLGKTLDRLCFDGEEKAYHFISDYSRMYDKKGKFKDTTATRFNGTLDRMIQQLLIEDPIKRMSMKTLQQDARTIANLWYTPSDIE